MKVPRWSLRLSGDSSILARLPFQFQATKLQISQDPGGAYYLYSSDFDATMDDVYEVAKEKLSILLGATAVLFGPGHRLEFDSIREVRADGTATHVKYGSFIAAGHPTLTVR